MAITTRALAASAAVGVLLLAGCSTQEPVEAETSEPAKSTAAAPKPEPSPPADEPDWTDEDVEYQLAVIDTGGFVPHDDPVIEKYARALDGAEKRCPEDRRMLGDMTVRALQVLDEEKPGHGETILTMLGALTDTAKPGKGKIECTELYSALLVLMTS